MKAPNKIYVSADPFGFMHAYDAENYPPDGEAYIRKDYFLEKIRKTAIWNTIKVGKKRNLRHSNKNY